MVEGCWGSGPQGLPKLSLIVPMAASNPSPTRPVVVFVRTLRLGTAIVAWGTASQLIGELGCESGCGRRCGLGNCDDAGRGSPSLAELVAALEGTEQGSPWLLGQAVPKATEQVLVRWLLEPTGPGSSFSG